MLTGSLLCRQGLPAEGRSPESTRSPVVWEQGTGRGVVQDSLSTQSPHGEEGGGSIPGDRDNFTGPGWDDVLVSTQGPAGNHVRAARRPGA